MSVFIVSAPSGAGKTSLVDAILAKHADIARSISHTTRAPRGDEANGVDYFFVTSGEFESMIAEGAFLEYARVFENYYGTAKATIDKILEQKSDLILEIDWQGAQQVRKIMPSAISVFILPPSWQELKRRITDRDQDDEKAVELRLKTASSEVEHCKEFDYVIVNDDFDQATKEFESIIIANRISVEQQMQKQKRLLDELKKQE